MIRIFCSGETRAKRSVSLIASATAAAFGGSTKAQKPANTRSISLTGARASRPASTSRQRQQPAAKPVRRRALLEGDELRAPCRQGAQSRRRRAPVGRKRRKWTPATPSRSPGAGHLPQPARRRATSRSQKARRRSFATPKGPAQRFLPRSLRDEEAAHIFACSRLLGTTRDLASPFPDADQFFSNRSGECVCSGTIGC